MFMRLSKESRRYILKAERPEFWKKRIADLKKETADLEAKPLLDQDEEAIEEKKSELKTAEEQSVKNLEKVEVYGPTVWLLKSVPQLVIDQIMDRLDKPVMKIRGKGKDEVSSKQVGYTRTMSREVCKKGVVGWENLKDTDKGEDIVFDPALIDELPFDITSELGNQISGVVDEDETVNLK